MRDDDEEDYTPAWLLVRILDARLFLISACFAFASSSSSRPSCLPFGSRYAPSFGAACETYDRGYAFTKRSLDSPSTVDAEHRT